MMGSAAFAGMLSMMGLAFSASDSLGRLCLCLSRCSLGTCKNVSVAPGKEVVMSAPAPSSTPMLVFALALVPVRSRHPLL